MQIDVSVLRNVFAAISEIIAENKEYLTLLDQQNGDGDLGISMDNGYAAISAYIHTTNETDLGKIFMQAAMTFNEAAPSSLGTITSFALMGMAKKLKGKIEANLEEIIEAMDCGSQLVMERAKSKPGEKTILDALVPGIQALKEYGDQGCQVAFRRAAQVAAEGAEKTKEMRSVHGRSAYYGDGSIGIIDGGAVVGKLIFEAISHYCDQKESSI